MLHLKALSSFFARQLKALRCYEIFTQASRVTYTQSGRQCRSNPTTPFRTAHLSPTASSPFYSDIGLGGRSFSGDKCRA
eukprot:401665-Prymnesium_polylepis.1